ncbi:MAG TPA: outer membrane beta-barrel protein [Usitatibacter sp.]|jgi:opacity protein-like surface antigen|nr:outer membrane beta-barrel protein [Usitatibacter sp.]
MRNAARFLPLALAFLGAGIAAPALAQSGGWYAGLAGGQSRTDRDIVRTREETLLSAPVVQSDFDATGDAWKAFAGYRFTPYVAVEAAYADLGRDRMSSFIPGNVSQLPAAFTIDRRVEAYGADVVGTLPIGPRFALLARAGAYRAHVRSDVVLDGNIVFADDATARARRITDNRTIAHYGVGGEWRFARRMALRLEWERFADAGSPFAVGQSGRTGRADTDAVTLGVVFDLR